MSEETDNSQLDWAAIKEAGVALGINPSTWPIDSTPVVTTIARDADVEMTDAEWAAIQHVLPADWGADRRLVINSALWIVSTGRPWTLLPESLGKWDSQRRRFARWAFAGHWSKISEAIQAAPDVTTDRKRLFQRIADKAARQVALLPEHRARVTGFRE